MYSTAELQPLPTAITLLFVSIICRLLPRRMQIKRSGLFLQNGVEIEVPTAWPLFAAAANNNFA